MRDRDIVASLVAGDPGGLAAAYDSYAAGLHGYCRVLLGGPDEAPDAVQETFIAAAAKVGVLRSPDRLRPWLYAEARHACQERLRQPGRAARPDESELDGSRPETAGFTTARAEQRHLVLTALAGLSPADREVAELVTRHDLDGADLAAVLGVTVSQAGALASRARGQLEQALGPLVVARTGRPGCLSLDELLDSWDGRLTPAWRRRVSRHALACATCAERMHWALGPAMLLSLAPLLPPPAAMRAHVLDLVADDGPDAIAYRARVISRAGPFDPAGFPVQIAPTGWAGRSGRVPRRGRAGRGRRAAGPQPGRWASLAQRPGRAAAVAAAVLLGLAVAGVGITSLAGGGHGTLTAGSVGTAAPFGVPGSAASGDPASSLTPRSPSGKPVLARSSPSPSPAAQPSRHPAPSSPPRTAAPSHSFSSAPPPPPRPVLSESPGTVVLAQSPLGLSGSGTFTLTAANGPVSYSISIGSPAVSVSVPRSGTVTPGDPLTVTVTYQGLLGPLPASITVNSITIALAASG